MSPTNEHRDLAKKIIGDDDFIDIYISAPIKISEARDTKRDYKELPKDVEDFTNISSEYELPQKPALEIKTEELSINQCAQKIFDFILPHIEYTE